METINDLSVPDSTKLPNSVQQIPSVRLKAITLGFWSALLTAIFTILFVISTFIYLPPAWQGIQSYSKSFSSIQLISVIPCMIFALTNVMLLISFHYYFPEHQRIFSMLGIAFTVIYATIIWINGYLQLFVLRLNLLQGQLENLAILAMPNPHSVFYALEAIGYGFLSIALLAISPVFKGKRLANWIRGLFIVTGILGIYGIVIALFDKPVLIISGLGIWMILYPISMVLVCIFFKSERSMTVNK